MTTTTTTTTVVTAEPTAAQLATQALEAAIGATPAVPATTEAPAPVTAAPVAPVAPAQTEGSMSKEEAQAIIDAAAGKRGRPSKEVMAAREVLGMTGPAPKAAAPASAAPKAPKAPKTAKAGEAMTLEEAKAIVDASEGKRGRKPAAFFTALKVMGVTKAQYKKDLRNRVAAEKTISHVEAEIKDLDKALAGINKKLSVLQTRHAELSAEREEAQAALKAAKVNLS